MKRAAAHRESMSSAAMMAPMIAGTGRDFPPGSRVGATVPDCDGISVCVDIVAVEGP